MPDAFTGLRGILGGMRRVNPGERPRFGSVWTWGTQMNYLRLMALAPDRTVVLNPEDEIGVIFMDVASGRVDDNWGWVTRPVDDPEIAWYCVDEGSPEAPYV